MVLQGRPIGIREHNDDSTLDINEMPAFSTKMPSIIEQLEVNDVLSLISEKVLQEFGV